MVRDFPRTWGDGRLMLLGTEGYIEVPWPWKPQVKGATYTIARSIPPRQDNAGKVAGPPPRQNFTVDAGMELYALEADEFAATVRDGQGKNRRGDIELRVSVEKSWSSRSRRDPPRRRRRCLDWSGG